MRAGRWRIWRTLSRARQLGISKGDFIRAVRLARAVALEVRRDDEDCRRRAWELYLYFAGREVVGSVGFWRCGWDKVRARLHNAGKDFTHVPGYDLIARTIAYEFPRWRGREAAELYDWLFSGYERRPGVADFCEEALAMFASAGESVVPF